MTPTWQVVVFAALSLALVLTVYYFVLKPIVYLPTADDTAVCPNRWVYNPGSKLCEPAYTTSCHAFDPVNPMFASATEKCAIAKSCGTEWVGLKCS